MLGGARGVGAAGKAQRRELDGSWASAGGIGGIVGGGGVLQVYTYLRPPPDRHPPAEPVAPLDVNWSVFPERVRLTLSYVAHVAQWQIALYDLARADIDLAGSGTDAIDPSDPGGRYKLGRPARG